MVQAVNTSSIFSIKDTEEFEKLTLQVFLFQSEKCGVYAKFLKYLKVDPKSIKKVGDIPYLPVEFFKNHSITCSNLKPELIFTSSGTSGNVQSKHFVNKKAIYERSFKTCFEKFYGDIKEYTILALLPSYLERDGSSLIYMVDDLIRCSEKAQSGYYLHNHSDLFNTLIKFQKSKSKTLLIGVTYALLDFAESHTLEFPELIVMETGGMKGKRKELIRGELHEILCCGFGVPTIHSEYGMTELLSQAYSKGGGEFHCPPWMQVAIRDTNDPLTLLEIGKVGGINIIDLANIDSCSFIATQDLGKLTGNNYFEVLGRFDNSDIRGCNLLV